MPKNSHEINIKVRCDNKLIKNTQNTKFLVLAIDSSLSWKDHIDEIMIKLSRACYAVRFVQHFMSQGTLGTIFFSYFHYILLYRIIWWGNSAYSSDIFKIKKRVIRIIMNAKNRDSCHQLCENLKILPLKSRHIFSLLLLVAINRDLYELNSEIHNISTIFSSDVHTATANLKTFKKFSFILGSKFLISLLLATKIHLVT